MHADDTRALRLGKAYATRTLQRKDPLDGTKSVAPKRSLTFLPQATPSVALKHCRIMPHTVHWALRRRSPLGYRYHVLVAAEIDAFCIKQARFLETVTNVPDLAFAHLQPRNRRHAHG